MIEINKLSKENTKFGFKLFFSYIIFTVLLITSIAVIHIQFSDDIFIEKFAREVKLQSEEKKDNFDIYIKRKKDAIAAISRNEYFLEFIKTEEYRYYINLLLLTVMESNKDYMQMRYIDEKGFEKLRFERESHSGNIIKKNVFQNKKNRYYFNEVSKLKKGEIWVSQIDLNIEHGKIEKPNKPVLRIGTPLYVENKFKGIFIINIFMKELIQSITKSSLYDIYLVDDQGYYIRHKEAKYNWSSYDTKHKISDDFEDSFVNKISNKKHQSLIVDDKIYLQSLFIDNQKLNMILVEKESSKLQVKNNNRDMVVTILIFATIMSILFTVLFTRAIENIFKLVVNKADELHEIASKLDEKVTMKTLEIAKKDRLLQNQSKLAELGDMIGNIAHQWRHPLTRLSLTLQTLSAYKKKNKMTDEKFNESITNSLYQIEFMSTTIDNFKDFYKKDESKSNFSVKEAIESVLNIISTVLEHSNINLTVSASDEIIIYANKNEFAQVLMNLIINAKDAIDEQKIKNGQININIYKEEKVRIEVSDNGNGIPNCLIEEVFSPYFTTKEKKGTGIGLYLAKAIIEDKMDGKLTVANDKLGAVFTIIL